MKTERKRKKQHIHELTEMQSRLAALDQAESERRQIDAGWREISETLQTMIAGCPAAIIAVDHKGKVTQWSPAAERILGWRKQDVIGWFHPIVPEEILEKVRVDVSPAIGWEIYSSEMRCRKKDGSLIDISISTATLRNAEGEITGAVGIMDDITERKLIEEERERLIFELKKELLEVKKLSGLLPICSSCKKIRNDQGYWEYLEGFIKKRSEAEFTHGICPECAKILYPEFYKKKPVTSGLRIQKGSET